MSSSLLAPEPNSGLSDMAVLFAYTYGNFTGENGNFSGFKRQAESIIGPHTGLVCDSLSLPKCGAGADTDTHLPLPLSFWQSSVSHHKAPQSSQQEKTFSLRLMGTNSALYPQRGQDNVLMLQFLTIRFLHYLIDFILLIYSDWSTVTLKESWVDGPFTMSHSFKIRGVYWNKLLVPLLLQLIPKTLSPARKQKGRKGKLFFVKTDCF